MKQLILSEEEMRVLALILRSNWVPIEYQQVIYNLIRKIDKELEN